MLERSALDLKAVLKHLSLSGWEILIVDDGSTDRTSGAAGRLSRDDHIRLIRHGRNRGKGAAVRTGVLASRGDMVLICDADMSTPPSMLGPFLREASHGADMVIGDRRSPDARIGRRQPLVRRVLGGGYAALARQVAGAPIRDFNCGFKLIRGDAARSLLKRCRSNRWVWDVEVIALAIRCGMVVRAIPVTWNQGDRSSVRPFRAAMGSLLELASLWVRLLIDKST